MTASPGWGLRAEPGLSGLPHSEDLTLLSSREPLGAGNSGGPGPAAESGPKGGCGVGPRLSAKQTLTSLSQEPMDEAGLPPAHAVPTGSSPGSPGPSDTCEVYASNSSLMLLMMLTGLEPEAKACREQSLPKLARLEGRVVPASPPRGSSSTTVNTSSSSPFSSTGCCRVTVVVSRPLSRWRPRADGQG